MLSPPLEKGGRGDLKTCQATMLSYNKRLKPLSRSLRSNMTDAERLLWSKIRRNMKEIIIIKSPFIPLFQRGRQELTHTLARRPYFPTSALF